MPSFSTAVAVLAALAMIAVSALLNYLFFSAQAPPGIESLALGGVSVAADVMKAVLPILIVAAVAYRRWIYVGIASAAFLFFVVFSLTNAAGFAAKNRHLIVGEREALNARYAVAVKSLEELEAKRRALAVSRPPDVLAQLMRRTEQAPRWRASKSCTEATAKASRDFCDGYFALKTEAASALLADKLDAEIAKARALVSDLRDRGGAIDPDAQVSILAKLLGIDQEWVRVALILLAALLVEVGSGLGLYLAVGYKPSGVNDLRQNARDHHPWRDPVLGPSPAPVGPKPSVGRTTASGAARDAGDGEPNASAGAPEKDAPRHQAEPPRVDLEMPPPSNGARSRANGGAAEDDGFAGFRRARSSARRSESVKPNGGSGQDDSAA